MTEEKCFQFTVKDKVQDVGLRLAIAKRVPDELEVRADNLPNGSVMVFVKGTEEDAKKFWNGLQKDILGKKENPTFSELETIPIISINTDRFFHKLQCEQLGKFVDIGLKSFNDLGTKVDDGFNSLGTKLDNGFSNLGTKLDELPKKLAKAIKGE